MKQNSKIDELISEINVMPSQIESDIANDQEINIELYIEKIQNLIKAIDSLPDDEISGYRTKILGYGDNINELIHKLKDRQKLIKEEIQLLDKRLKAQKAYSV